MDNIKETSKCEGREQDLQAVLFWYYNLNLLDLHGPPNGPREADLGGPLLIEGLTGSLQGQN